VRDDGNELVLHALDVAALGDVAEAHHGAGDLPVLTHWHDGEFDRETRAVLAPEQLLVAFQGCASAHYDRGRALLAWIRTAVSPGVVEEVVNARPAQLLEGVAGQAGSAGVDNHAHALRIDPEDAFGSRIQNRLGAALQRRQSGDLTFDRLRHLVEGARGAADFIGAAQADATLQIARGNGLGSRGKALHRTRDVAGQHERHDEPNRCRRERAPDQDLLEQASRGLGFAVPLPEQLLLHAYGNGQAGAHTRKRPLIGGIGTEHVQLELIRLAGKRSPAQGNGRIRDLAQRALEAHADVAPALDLRRVVGGALHQLADNRRIRSASLW